jgi:hypothetical protein
LIVLSANRKSSQQIRAQARSDVMLEQQRKLLVSTGKSSLRNDDGIIQARQKAHREDGLYGMQACIRTPG